MVWKKSVRITITVLAILLFCLSVFAGSNGDLEKGIELFDSQEYAEAKRMFNTIVDKDSKNSEAWYYLGRLCFIDGDLDKAIKYLKKAIKLNGNSSEYHLWLGNVYGTKIDDVGKIKKAFMARKTRNEFEKAVELDADNIEARFGLVVYCLNAPAIMGGGIKKAKEQAKEINNRDLKRGHEAYGGIYWVEKKYDLAEKELREAINLAPENKDLYYNLSSMYKSMKEYEKAVAILEEMLQKYPDDVKAFFNIGWAYVDSSQFDKAFMTFEKIIENDPKVANAYYQWGRTSVLSGQRLENADKYFTKYLEMKQFENNPSEANAHYRLGMVYEMTGRVEQAKNQYQIAVKLDRNYKDAKSALAKLK